MSARTHRNPIGAPALVAPAGGSGGARPRLCTVPAIALACTPSVAFASYAQMTLPGLAADILFALIAAWMVLVDFVLVCRGFRSRAAIIVTTAISLLLVFGLLKERASVAAVFQLLATDWQATLLGVSLVVVPVTMIAAPLAQHFELRSQRPRRAVWIAIAVQVALAGVAGVSTYFRDHPLESTRAEWAALGGRGERVRAGELAALRDAFEARHVWGSIESLQLLKGLEKSELIASGPPLTADDRAALVDMLDRDRAATRPMGAGAHWYGRIEAKLLWDTLEPGGVARSIPPGTVLSDEYLLPFIDQHGPQRLCSNGEFADADRSAFMRALSSGRGAETGDRVARSLDRLAAACGALPPSGGT